MDFSKVITADQRMAEEAERQRLTAIADAMAYLAQTDQKVLWALEDGVAVPQDVSDRRKAARAVIAGVTG